MIAEPARRGQALAAFWLAVAPRLWDDLLESDVLAAADATSRARQCREWECFALYACVRGLIAAGGFNRETSHAIDALHERVLEHWMLDTAALEPFEARRARVAARYAEYGAIGQASEAAGAAALGLRLGEAAARHLVDGDPPPALAELVGTLHETLAVGAAEAVRIAAEPA